jgi:hypothetical protein
VFTAGAQDPSPYGPIKIAPIKAPPPIAPPKSRPPAEPKPTSDPKPSDPNKPHCDRCEDLPKLMQELKEQEWLRDKFWSYTRFSDYQYTAPDVRTMYCRVQCAMNEWQGRSLCPPRKCDEPPKPSEECGGGSGASMDMGLDPDTCKLYMCALGKDGKRRKVPFDRKQKETQDCPEIVDYLLAHETSHQKTCQALKAKGQSAYFDKPEFTALDEVKAYEAGIKSLEKAINALANRCKEKGTRVSYRLPDDFKVTPDQVTASQDEARRIADALRKFQEQGRKP